jgi:hypothetical protein
VSTAAQRTTAYRRAQAEHPLAGVTVDRSETGVRFTCACGVVVGSSGLVGVSDDQYGAVELSAMRDHWADVAVGLIPRKHR